VAHTEDGALDPQHDAAIGVGDGEVAVREAEGLLGDGQWHHVRRTELLRQHCHWCWRSSAVGRRHREQGIGGFDAVKDALRLLAHLVLGASAFGMQGVFDSPWFLPGVPRPPRGGAICSGNKRVGPAIILLGCVFRPSDKCESVNHSIYGSKRNGISNASTNFPRKGL
jgi:hypothetical protein